MVKRIFFVSFLLIYSCALFAEGVDSLSIPKRVYTTSRLSGLAPVIDGKLEDDAWFVGVWSGDFSQQLPQEGVAPSRLTELKILYDDVNLYVAIKAYDDPSDVDLRRGKRDEFYGDMVGICFDSYHDYRTGFEFNITASGSKVDQILLNNNNDLSWNAVWDGKTAILDSMWTAEMRIPLSQLRFSGADEQIWGMHAWRWINRYAEQSHWNLIPRNNAGALYHFGELRGVKHLRRSGNAELVPYVAGMSQHRKVAASNPFNSGSLQSYNMGIDGKIALSSNFMTNFTINPDFGQVEADPANLNLSVFESYFDEKRPFFLEGRNIFEFTGFNPFYSRRIGQSPRIRPDYDENKEEFADIPQYTTILGAFKLSGKTDNGWSVGLMEGLTKREEYAVSRAGQIETALSEPLANYVVARVQKDIDKGNSMVGGILTTTNRSTSESHDLIDGATTGGVDFFHHWAQKTYFVKGSVIGSRVSGNQQSILDLQQRSSHYYQRPDASYVGIDSSATALSGMGSTFSIGKISKGRWRYNTGYDWRSPGLELNELGFMPNADQFNWQSKVEYEVTEPKSFYRDFGVWANMGNAWTNGGEHLWTSFSAGIWMGFKNKWSGNIRLGRVLASIDPRLLRGGSAVNVPSHWNPNVYFSTDEAKTVSASVGYGGSFKDDKITFNHNISPSVSWKIGQTLNLSSGFTYSVSRDMLFYVDAFDRPGNDKLYLMGQQDRQTLGFNIRANWSITPDITLQYYGNPYVSAGKFSNYKIITNPLANQHSELFEMIPDSEMSYDEADNRWQFNNQGNSYGFNNPGFEFQEIRSNFAFRWEFKPGSTIYAVWTHNRSAYNNLNDASLNNGLSELGTISPQNVFLVKLSYWIPI